MRRDLVPMQSESNACRACLTVSLLLGLLVVAGIAMNVPDVARYLKLKVM